MPSLIDAVPIIIGQSFASGFGYFFFFRLQQAGGPVISSQISYVNTTVGVFFAAILFSEPIGAITLLAVLLIFAGIALVNVGKSAASRQRPDAALNDRGRGGAPATFGRDGRRKCANLSEVSRLTSVNSAFGNASFRCR